MMVRILGIVFGVLMLLPGAGALYLVRAAIETYRHTPAYLDGQALTPFVFLAPLALLAMGCSVIGILIIRRSLSARPISAPDVEGDHHAATPRLIVWLLGGGILAVLALGVLAGVLDALRS
jgi:NADH:ubiquinone oxidoreductase subunit 5 (subunit L)/multisubunit Na+/H+ antiporter MnhA subunit